MTWKYSGLLRLGSICFEQQNLDTYFSHYLCAWKYHRVLIFTKVKVHLCGFIWLRSWPHLSVTWSSLAAHNATVVGTLSGKEDMLEETWEHDTLHEGLPQYLLSDFILGNYLHFLRTGKRRLLRGVVKVHFVCLEGYGSLLQISQNKIMKYAWYLPPRSKNRLQQLLQELLLGITIVISTLTTPCSLSWDKIQQRMKAILDYPKLRIHCRY